MRIVALFTLLTAAGLSLTAPRLRAQNAQADAAARYTSLVRLTTMTVEGKSPFHIKLDVQLADFKGQPLSSGTAEEWWISPRQYRIEYTAGNLHKTVASGVEDTGPTVLHREYYLLSEALAAWISPLRAIRENEVVKREARMIGKSSFDCLEVGELPISSGGAFACADTGMTNLRISGIRPEVLLRDRVGMFQGTEVPLSASLSYNSVRALTANVTVLRRFDPSSAEAVETKVGELPSESARVTRGSLLNKVQPEYPVMARQQHISGTVVMEGLIDRNGRFAQLIPIASPDELLTSAALRAVRQWTYKPYLLNGKPVELDTTILVNFNMSIP